MSWLLLTIAVLTVGFLLTRLLKNTLRMVFTCFFLVVAAVVVAGTVICWNAPDTETADADYAVLLGCSLKKGEPTEEMFRRLELGLQWLQANADKTLIVSGGGSGTAKEGQIMYNWLREQGADMNRVLMEDRASNTRENLIFSRELAAEHGLCTNRVAILTSEYHQTRARYLAEQLGQESSGISCETPFLKHLEAAVREVYSFVKAFFQTL